MRHDDADQNAEYARRKNLESYEIERKEKEEENKKEVKETCETNFNDLDKK